MQARLRRQGCEGFTFTEGIVVFVVLVIIFLVVMIYAFRYAREVTATYTGNWTLVPLTIPPAPGSGTFVFHMTVQPDAASSPTNAVGRSIKFDLSVTSKSGTIISCNGVTIAPVATTCTANTDANGNLTIVVSLEKTGVATLTATDVKRNLSEKTKVFKAP